MRRKFVKRAAGSLLAVMVGLGGLRGQSAGQEITFDEGPGRLLVGLESDDGKFAVVLGKGDSNVIVNLVGSHQVMKLTAESDWQFPYSPNGNHGSLDVLWGPDQVGSRFAVLLYGAKWETAHAILIEVDLEYGTQTDILEILQAGAVAEEKSKGVAGLENYVFEFTMAGLYDPAAEPDFPDPVDVWIDYRGQVPKSEDDATLEGALVVRLSRTDDGPRAEVISTSVADGGEAGTGRRVRRRLGWRSSRPCGRRSRRSWKVRTCGRSGCTRTARCRGVS